MKKTIILLMLIASLFLVMTACSPSPNEDVGTDDPGTNTPTTPETTSKFVNDKLAVEKTVLTALSGVSLNEILNTEGQLDLPQIEKNGVKIESGSVSVMGNSRSVQSYPVRIQISAIADGKKVDIVYDADVTLKELSPSDIQLDTIVPTNVDAKVDNVKAKGIEETYVPVAMLTFKDTSAIFNNILDLYQVYYLSTENIPENLGLVIKFEESFILINKDGINASIVFQSDDIDTEFHKLIVKGKQESLEFILDGWTSIKDSDTPTFEVEENPAVKPEDTSNMIADEEVLNLAGDIFTLETAVINVCMWDIMEGENPPSFNPYDTVSFGTNPGATIQIPLQSVKEFGTHIFDGGTVSSFTMSTVMIPEEDANPEIYTKVTFEGLPFKEVEFSLVADLSQTESNEYSNEVLGWFEYFKVDGKDYNYLYDGLFKRIAQVVYPGQMMGTFYQIIGESFTDKTYNFDESYTGKGAIITHSDKTFEFSNFQLPLEVSNTPGEGGSQVKSYLNVSGNGVIVTNNSIITKLKLSSFTIEGLGEVPENELKNANYLLTEIFPQM